MSRKAIYARERNVITGWDLAVAVVGAVAALLAGSAMYVSRKRQARREQRFGESLRDQLDRRIAQLDDQATRARLTNELVLVTMGGICPTAILFLGFRVNGKSISDDGYILVTLIIACVWMVASGVWELRRQAREVLPRKHRLEAVLKELDAP
jgi:Flp pilus assembly protein TadB